MHIRQRCVVIIVLIAATYFVYLWLSLPLLPGRAFPLGYYGWFDQSVYLRMAESMARFELPRRFYLYGPGYPILGAVFTVLYPYDPFFPPDTILWILFVYAWAFSYHFFLERNEALYAVLLLVFATPVIHYFLIPWNNSVTAVSLALMTLIGTRAIANAKIDNRVGLAFGLLLGWSLSARYVDMLFMFPFALVVLLHDRKNRPWKTPMGLMIAGISCFAAALALSQALIFGSPLITPYAFHPPNQQDLSSYNVTKIPQTLFYNFLFHPFSTFYTFIEAPMLGQAFFFIFAPLGLIRPFRGRLLVFSLFFGFVMATLFYSSFIGLEATGSSLKYLALRYFHPWYPVLVILSIKGFRYIVGSR